MLSDRRLEVDKGDLVLPGPFGDRLDGAGPAVVGLAVRLSDVHRRQRRDERYARPIEVDCPTSHFEVLRGKVRRQGGARYRRQPRLYPAVAAAHPAPKPRRPDVPNQLTQGGGQRRRQRIHATRREDHRAGPWQRRPRPRVLGGGPPDVPAGPADPPDHLDVPTQVSSNDIRPYPRIVGGQPAAGPVIRQRVAEDEKGWAGWGHLPLAGESGATGGLGPPVRGHRLRPVPRRSTRRVASGYLP